MTNHPYVKIMNHAMNYYFHAMIFFSKFTYDNVQVFLFTLIYYFTYSKKGLESTISTLMYYLG